MNKIESDNKNGDCGTLQGWQLVERSYPLPQPTLYSQTHTAPLRGAVHPSSHLGLCCYMPIASDGPQLMEAWRQLLYKGREWQWCEWVFCSGCNIVAQRRERRA